MGTIQKAFSNSFSDFRYLIKNQAGPLLGIMIGCEAILQLLKLMQGSAPSEIAAQTIGFALLELSVTMIEGFLVTILVYRRLYEWQNSVSATDFLTTLKTYFTPLVNESLRAIGVTLLWSLFLIIPGIYKYFRLLFVMNVVLLDPYYLEGKVDALEESHRMTQGLWLALLIISILFSGLTYWLEISAQKIGIFGNFPLWSVFSLASMLVILYLNIVFYEIYVVKKESFKESA